jgi:hypothetical protein
MKKIITIVVSWVIALWAAKVFLSSKQHAITHLTNHRGEFQND